MPADNIIRFLPPRIERLYDFITLGVSCLKLQTHQFMNLKCKAQYESSHYLFIFNQNNFRGI